MKGIPVLESGDPLRLTLVVAGSFAQFRNWCRYSQVNSRSRNIKYLSGVWNIRGYSDFDVVYTGTEAQRRDLGPVHREINYYQALGEVGQFYYQFESADIEPNIVHPETVCVSQEDPLV